MYSYEIILRNFRIFLFRFCKFFRDLLKFRRFSLMFGTRFLYFVVTIIERSILRTICYDRTFSDISEIFLCAVKREVFFISTTIIIFGPIHVFGHRWTVGESVWNAWKPNDPSSKRKDVKKNGPRSHRQSARRTKRACLGRACALITVRADSFSIVAAVCVGARTGWWVAYERFFQSKNGGTIIIKKKRQIRKSFDKFACNGLNWRKRANPPIVSRPSIGPFSRR